MKKIIKAVLIFFIAAGILFYLQAPAEAAVNASKSAACKGVAGCEGDANDNGVNDVVDAIRAIINLITVIVGIIAVIMIIINGFRFITSGGDSNTVTSARNGLLYAIIGLIIVVLAQVIVRFVLTKV